MDERKLYEIVDFILNEAAEGDLEVLRAALRRREGDSVVPGGEQQGAMGLDVGKMARETAASVKRQLGVSQDQIREMVRRQVRDVIRREAPQLPDSQIDLLLAEWIPDPSVIKKRKAQSSTMPVDALLTMIRQFVAYGTGSMKMTEEQDLRQDIGDWQTKYWAKFPTVVQRLISLYLKGAIDDARFWQGIYDELGIEAGE